MDGTAVRSLSADNAGEQLTLESRSCLVAQRAITSQPWEAQPAPGFDSRLSF